MNSSIKFVWDDNVLLHEVLRKNGNVSDVLLKAQQLNY